MKWGGKEGNQVQTAVASTFPADKGILSRWISNEFDKALQSPHTHNEGLERVQLYGGSGHFTLQVLPKQCCLPPP